MSVFIYVLGWVVCYPVIMREVVRSHRKDFPSLEWSLDDSIFTVGWSALVALLWPVLAPVYVVARLVHPKLRNAASDTKPTENDDAQS